MRVELAELLRMPPGVLRLRCAKVSGTWIFSRHDCIALLLGGDEAQARKLWHRMLQEHPEMKSSASEAPGLACGTFRFDGEAQHDTPVAGIEGIVEMLLLVPGRRAARFRKAV